MNTKYNKELVNFNKDMIVLEAEKLVESKKLFSLRELEKKISIPVNQSINHFLSNLLRDNGFIKIKKYNLKTRENYSVWTRKKS